MYLIARLSKGARLFAVGTAALFAFCVMPGAASAAGPWSPVAGTPSMSGLQWADTSCLPGTQQCVAVGNASGTAEIAGNLSGSWQTMAGGSPASGAYYASYLSGVSCVNTSFCVAVGYSQSPDAPLIAIYNGSSWTYQTLTVQGGSGSYGLFGISCVSTQSCVAVGGVYEYSAPLTSAAALVETFNGTGWTQTLIADPGSYQSAPAELESVSCQTSAAC
ncbi:MAG: hypothetical protein ACLP0L_06520 [Solirubrobacteraceae bacterium]